MTILTTTNASPILAVQTTGSADSIETKRAPLCRWAAEPVAAAQGGDRRQVLSTTRRRTKGRAFKLRKSKSVTFSTDEQGEITTHVREYDECVSDEERSQVYSQDADLRESRRHCHETVQATYRNDPDYRKNVIRMFRSRGFHQCERDLAILSDSPCRGLERKLSPIFGNHRRWAIGGVMKMQETENNQECLRYFSKRASQPCVNFARLLATADRKAADEIYFDDASNHSSSSLTNYWSDSSRSLESTDSIDTC